MVSSFVIFATILAAVQCQIIPYQRTAFVPSGPCQAPLAPCPCQACPPVPCAAPVPVRPAYEIAVPRIAGPCVEPVVTSYGTVAEVCPSTLPVGPCANPFLPVASPVSAMMPFSPLLPPANTCSRCQYLKKIPIPPPCI